MIPTNVVMHQQSKVLELSYENGSAYRLPFEFLRVLSPSAEVRGHGPGQETLQTGKREVGINELEPVGHYAIRPMFSWEYLYFLCENQDALWNDYLDKLKQAGASRDVASAQTGHEGHSCGNK
jgi:DUF971 family protein